MRWIKCSEKLPNAGDLVVIFMRYSGYKVTKFTDDYQFSGEAAFVDFNFNKLTPYKIYEIESWIKLPNAIKEIVGYEMD